MEIVGPVFKILSNLYKIGTSTQTYCDFNAYFTCLISAMKHRQHCENSTHMNIDAVRDCISDQPHSVELMRKTVSMVLCSIDDGCKFKSKQKRYEMRDMNSSNNEVCQIDRIFFKQKNHTCKGKGYNIG